MLLVDTSQILISSATMEMKLQKVDAGFLRHIFFSKILSIKKKFPEYSDKIVLALDDKDYWRKDVFPFYKGTRKKMREKSTIDWDSLFTSLNEVIADLEQLNYYSMVRVSRCEADDVIATICKYSQNNELVKQGLVEEPQLIKIISADTDLAQLQKYKNVSQWSPMQKKQVKPDDLRYFMFEHIMRGDTGDGVPNILSPDNSLMDGIRQKPMTEKFIQEVMKMSDPHKELTGEVLRNYQRNEKLVNLDFIPQSYEDAIIAEYEAQKPKKDKMKLMMYFQQHRMKVLSESLQEF